MTVAARRTAARARAPRLTPARRRVLEKLAAELRGIERYQERRALYDAVTAACERIEAGDVHARAEVLEAIDRLRQHGADGERWIRLAEVRLEMTALSRARSAA